MAKQFLKFKLPVLVHNNITSTNNFFPYYNPLMTEMQN